MLKSSLFDYSDAYILVKRTITVNNTAAADADANNANKKVILKNCAPFTDSKSEINNVEIDNAKDIDIIMLMYTLIEYRDNYWKQSGSLWKYLQDIPAVNNNVGLLILVRVILLIHLILKKKIKGQSGNDGTKGVEIMVSLKNLDKFLRTLEILFINCEINIILVWSAIRV